MRILICSERDLSSVVILNDLLEWVAKILNCAISMMLAEWTRAVETVAPSLIQMKSLMRDVPPGVLFLLLARENDNESVIDDNSERYELPVASPELPPAAAGRPFLSPRRLGEQYGISPMVVLCIEDLEMLAAANSLATDLIVPVRFRFKFREDFIALLETGILNIHPRRLPDYAGLHPHFYSMLAGESAIVWQATRCQGISHARHLQTIRKVIGSATSCSWAWLNRCFAENSSPALLKNACVYAKTLTRLRMNSRDSAQKGSPSLNWTNDLLPRFGLFGGVSPSLCDAKLRDSRDSAKLGTTVRGLENV